MKWSMIIFLTQRDQDVEFHSAGIIAAKPQIKNYTDETQF